MSRPPAAFPCIGRALAVALLASLPASAQFTNLQPGRNFPAAEVAFGGNYTESLDLGDVDNDGDLDVLVANGGDIGNQPNRIFINQGGLQAGTEGDFVEETAVRFAGVTLDASRDIDLADIDGDGDLDALVANRGTSTIGQVSRFYVNQGGLQGGTVGVFAEDTDARWGSLVSVPLDDQVFGGNQGSWEGWSCDCDFGDLDDDGDPDLFASSYGPSINGSTDSRVFLNDGAGVFDELWPWADAAADTRLHTLDVELLDLDGDFDLDVFASSRDSQARVYLNMLFEPLPGATAPFEDVTQEALINTGSTLSGSFNYECEYGDLDEDGDFDLWMSGYQTFTEKLLVNQGEGGDGIVLLGESDFPGPDLIKGDPQTDDSEVDFLDFDGDGDLDVFSANFAGTNIIWANGTAQGLTGEIHRTGTGLGGGLYTFFEIPNADNGGQSKDGETADIDGDGDLDILIANDANQTNRIWINALGVPDTHAPVFQRITAPEGLPLSGEAIVHAQVRDNAGFQTIARSDARLFWSLEGGLEQSTFMVSQGGQQFRGVIPLGTTQLTDYSYRVEVTDPAGNTAVSTVRQVDGPFEDLGSALVGVAGEPSLLGTGSLAALSAGSLTLTDAASSATSGLFFGFAAVPQPFKGGTLLPSPATLLATLPTDAGGGYVLPFSMPATLPSGASFVVQIAIQDGAAVAGVALANALRGTVP